MTTVSEKITIETFIYRHILRLFVRIRKIIAFRHTTKRKVRNSYFLFGILKNSKFYQKSTPSESTGSS